MRQWDLTLIFFPMLVGEVPFLIFSNPTWWSCNQGLNGEDDTLFFLYIVYSTAPRLWLALGVVWSFKSRSLWMPRGDIKSANSFLSFQPYVCLCHNAVKHDLGLKWCLTQRWAHDILDVRLNREELTLCWQLFPTASKLLCTSNSFREFLESQ